MVDALGMLPENKEENRISWIRGSMVDALPRSIYVLKCSCPTLYLLCYVHYVHTRYRLVLLKTLNSTVESYLFRFFTPLYYY